MCIYMIRPLKGDTTLLDFVKNYHHVLIVNSNYQLLHFLLRMPSTRSKKATARKSREADIVSDLEDMDVMLGCGEYNPIEREKDQMTGFSNTLDREGTR